MSTADQATKTVAFRRASSTQSLLNSTALLRLCCAGVLGLALTSALLATPAFAGGGAGGDGGSGFGSPGSDVPTGTASAASPTNAGGGGGGGAGEIGGIGGDGSGSGGGGGRGSGGQGGQNPGDPGEDGHAGDSSSGFGGGGGGGGAHGSVSVGLPGAAATGGRGGIGGVGIGAENAGGGGGGAGGWGMVIDGNATGTLFFDATGGAGGAGGEGAGINGGGGSGGSGGRGLHSVTDANLTIASQVTGGDGGHGGDGDLPLSAGGSGGAGGIGAFIGGTGTITVNSGSTVKGGDGGTPGTTLPNTLPGVGGAGGGGMYIDGSVNVTVNGAIKGGIGGHGFGVNGVGGDGGFGFSATHGGTVTVNSTGTVTGGGAGSGGGNTALGGEGIHGNNLTVVNSGSISGGLNADGTRANAVTFTGGTNVYELQGSGSAIGNVVDQTNDGTFKLGGATNSAFDISQIGSQYQGFNKFEKTGTSIWTLNNTANQATNWTITGGTLSLGAGASLVSTSTVTVNAGTFDISSSGANQTIGALSGLVGSTVNLGANTLTTGGDNTSTDFSGVISGIGGGFTKAGTGRLNLTGTSTYTGATIVDGGTLAVNGDISSSSSVTVNAGGTLGGNGVVGNTAINGGTLAPGNSIGLLTVNGNLSFTAASSYMVEVSPSNADRVNVTGTATLNGANVKTSYAPGSYLAKQYTILTAGNPLTDTFNGPVSNNLPSSILQSLSYDQNNVYLNTQIAFAVPGGLNQNQQRVGNALTNFFNTTGGIPLSFATLTPNGLTQASGELGTGAQQTTFQAMNLFMGLMTDPFAAGRGVVNNGPNAFADESESMAYASRAKSSKNPRDAFAAFTKAPPQAVFAQRWNVWAAGYGGSQTTDGNAVVGSNNTTSAVYGGAAGADYWFSPDTVAGFALAGGGSNFSVANGGSGRSDLFQAGAFVRHNFDATYLTAAVAYGWQDVTTDRYVSVAGLDHLRANFNANAYSGRLELGHRFLTPWFGGLGVSPYAAAQITAFELPSYAERAVSGASTFALNYGADTVTSSRTELGLRTDKSYALDGAVLTLRGRAAWAHDFNPDRAIGATFQTLPGASFVVNGAALASDSALTTASAEVRWLNGWSVAGTFEGEFSNVTRSYAGKGVVRYNW